MVKLFSKKKIVSLTIGALILATPLSASAHSLKELENQKDKLNQQSSQIHTQLTQNQNEIHTLTGKITKAEIKIGQTQTQIDALNKKMSATQTRIDKRTDILKQQVTASYKQSDGTNGMMNLLLDSQNFSDFINRAFAFYKITSHQQDLINQQKADEEALQSDMAKVAADKEAAQQTAQDLNQAMADLKTKIQDQKNQINTLSSQSERVKSQIQGKLSALSYSVPTTSSSNAPPAVQNQGASSSNTDGSTAQTISVPAIPKAAMSGSVSSLIANSKQWIGHSSYVFGGGRTSYDVSHGRFDCSGFVHWAFDSIGIDLGGWSTSTLQYVGSPVSPSDMQPGDLIFFDTYKHNGHVDIYIGNGEFIGSQTSTGVSIENIHSSYWAAHFNGVVRRVLN